MRDDEPVLPYADYGFVALPGCQRKEQCLFRRAIVREARDVVLQLHQSPIRGLYREWAETQDSRTWYPNTHTLTILDEPWADIEPAERRYLEALRDWGRRHKLEYDWIYYYANIEVATMSRLTRSKDLLGNGFAAWDNPHGVPRVDEPKPIRIRLRNWDPAMESYARYAEMTRYTVSILASQAAEEFLAKQKVETPKAFLSAGYVVRPKVRQGGDEERPYRWLARHVLLGESFTQIASEARPRMTKVNTTSVEDEGLDRSTVGKAVRLAAKNCGVLLPRNGK